MEEYFIVDFSLLHLSWPLSLGFCCKGLEKKRGTKWYVIRKSFPIAKERSIITSGFLDLEKESQHYVEVYFAKW